MLAAGFHVDANRARRSRANQRRQRDREPAGTELVSSCARQHQRTAPTKQSMDDISERLPSRCEHVLRSVPRLFPEASLYEPVTHQLPEPLR